MKSILHLLFVGLLFVCSCQPTQKIDKDFSDKYSTTSAKLFIEMARTLQAGDSIKASDWEALFSSEGYEAYFCGGSKEMKQATVKESLMTVFDPRHQQKLDSLLSHPIQMGPDLYQQLVLSNYASLKGNLNEAEQFLDQTDFADMLHQADSIALTFMPTEFKNASLDLHHAHFLCAEPDALVTSCGMTVDVNNAFVEGEDALVKLFAHEYHHVYRNAIAISYPHPLLEQMSKLQLEGIADLIDKPAPPYETLGLMPKNVVDFYNNEYQNTPEKLKALDSMTTAYISGDIDGPSFEQQIDGYFHFGGHPNGYYMARLIEQHIGRDSLILTVEDPLAFIRLYNTAASLSGNEYSFSSTFMDFVNSQKTILEEEANKYSDKQYQVTFIVTVPHEKDEVYITGNQRRLGDWNPGKVQVEKTGLKERKITLPLQAPAEFKFTRGNWDTEGFVKGFSQGPNMRLGFSGDTVVNYEIEAWIDQRE